MTIVAAAYQVGEMTISVPRPARHKDIPLDTFAWAHHVVWRARSNTVTGSLRQQHMSVSVVSRAYV